MELTSKIFGKPLEEITKEDFFNFFKEEREESSSLEFKSGEVKIDEIYSEICAFLNTDGGILIIGSPRETKKKVNNKTHKRVCAGEPVPSSFRNKNWIIQRLSANIAPLPQTIKIQEIFTDIGNYFIIEVPQSKNPPHQCLNEGRYYIRVDEQAKPAPHGIVQSLFLNRQKPLIKTNTELYKFRNAPDNELEIEVSIKNESECPADNISYIINIYNIENLISESDHSNSEKFRKLKEGVYELNETSKQVLIKRLTLPITFRIIHYYAPFILSIMVWGKDFGLYEDCFIWDPVNNCLIDGFKTGDNKDMEYQDLMQIFEEIDKNTL